MDHVLVCSGGQEQYVIHVLKDFTVLFVQAARSVARMVYAETGKQEMELVNVRPDGEDLCVKTAWMDILVRHACSALVAP
mmetsp:Transcript_35189/g.91304  ORF Transcript_35189/g.91304 Transcript_35189/m.91304 type:complete len:80 (+) Transcript_35189:182-421(+)